VQLRNKHKILFRKGEKFSYGRKLDGNITVKFKEEGKEVNWLYLAQNRVQCRAVLNYNEPAGSITGIILD
jgi:hypothetical protein